VRIIWFPLAALLSVGWLLLVSVLVSRGGGSGAQASDAAGLLRQSQEAMLELDSFDLQLTSLWDGQEATFRVAWESPDSFHALNPLLENYSESGQEPVIVDNGILEAIAIEDALYFRQCAPEGQDCQPWQEDVREDIYVPVIAPELEPFWTVELLGVMSDAQVVGQEDIEGVACTRIQGWVNVRRAMIQSWQHAEEIRGPIYWGEECSSGATGPNGETQEECHETTLGDYIAILEESAGEQDENLASVEVWIGRDDKLMRRLEFPSSTDPEAAGYFALSQFNEVDIQPPQ
jgi:hypothetical protein